LKQPENKTATKLMCLLDLSQLMNKIASELTNPLTVYSVYISKDLSPIKGQHPFCRALTPSEALGIR